MYVNKLINGCHFLDNNINWIIYQTCIISSLKTSEYLLSAKSRKSQVQKPFFSIEREFEIESESQNVVSDVWHDRVEKSANDIDVGDGCWGYNV